MIVYDPDLYYVPGAEIESGSVPAGIQIQEILITAIALIYNTAINALMKLDTVFVSAAYTKVLPTRRALNINK